jgi:outer membrane protein OmpA-like peptidoglycan-associated protein
MADYGIVGGFSMGLKGDFGTDFYDVSSLEALAFGRYYFTGILPFPFFLQAGAGFIMLFEDAKKVSTVLADGSVGIRFPVGNFYTEQYVRFGWPTGFGFAIALGYRFDFRPKKAEPPYIPPPPAEPEPPAPPVAAPEPPAPIEPVPQPVKEEVVIPLIPDIIFRANFADFAGRDIDAQRGLDEETISGNMRSIEAASEFLVSNPSFHILVEGFANPVLGTVEEEVGKLIPLSRSRASLVRDELIRLGVDPWRITVNAAGGAGRSSPSGNRRVELRIFMPPEQSDAPAESSAEPAAGDD